MRLPLVGGVELKAEPRVILPHSGLRMSKLAQFPEKHVHLFSAGSEALALPSTA